MRGIRGVFVIVAVVLPTGSVLAQPAIPNYSAPPDLRSGFDPNAMLGAEPKVLKKKESPAEAVLNKPIWSGGVELGMAGSSGNSDVFKIRTGFTATRKTDDTKLTSDLMYVLSEVAGTLTENKALWVLRDEMQLGESKWGLLMSEAMEFDQFRAFDFRNAIHSGLTRSIVKGERLTLKTRMGAGISYDLNTGTRDDRWVPEGMAGYDVEYKLTERVRLMSIGDYFPNVAQWAQWRLRVRAAGEFLILPEYGLVLRAGIQERYDSSPGTGRRNDIDYFTTILMKF